MIRLLSLRQGATRLAGHTYPNLMQTGGRIKNIKRHKPPSKIRAFSGFQSHIGSNFIDDKSVFEKKNVFKAVREKGLTAFL